MRLKFAKQTSKLCRSCNFMVKTKVLNSKFKLEIQKSAVNNVFCYSSIRKFMDQRVGGVSLVTFHWLIQ